MDGVTFYPKALCPPSSNSADVGTSSVPVAALSESLWLKDPAFLLKAGKRIQRKVWNLSVLMQMRKYMHMSRPFLLMDYSLVRIDLNTSPPGKSLPGL